MARTEILKLAIDKTEEVSTDHELMLSSLNSTLRTEISYLNNAQ